nr:hypothetical protein GZ18F2_2 [uncultured archaeon GZfos18F2]
MFIISSSKSIVVFPVITTLGMPGSTLFNKSITSSPEIPGILRSIKTRSGRDLFTSDKPESPSEAVTT